MSSQIVLKQSQNLALTQSMQQSLRVLQLTQQELELEIEAMLESNFMLEKEDVASENSFEDSEIVSEINKTHEESSLDFDSDRTIEVEDAWESYSDSGSMSDRNIFGDFSEDDDYNTDTYDISLQETLMTQLNTLRLSYRDQTIAHFIIDELDENGYFLMPFCELIETLNTLYPDAEYEEDEAQVVLKHIQHLEPAGIASRSLGECLAAQILAMEPPPTWKKSAVDLLTNHNELLSNLELKKIQKMYRMDDDSLAAMFQGLKHLNPYPASAYSFEKIEVIKPDIIVKQEGNHLTVTLNEEILPVLRLNHKYARLAKMKKSAETEMIKSQLSEAKFFIKSIEDRFDTLLKVSTAIVEAQKHYFFEGDKAIKPLRQQDIADQLGLNESTISRAVAGKFMACSQGVIPIQHLFSNQISTAFGADDDASGIAIRTILKEIIEEEPPMKPYSDQKLQVMLEEKGHSIARRTVAKYREMLGFKSSTERKRLA